MLLKRISRDAAAGVGLTSQYLEQFGRKLLGGLLGKAAGALSMALLPFTLASLIGHGAGRADLPFRSREIITWTIMGVNAGGTA